MAYFYWHQMWNSAICLLFDSSQVFTSSCLRQGKKSLLNGNCDSKKCENGFTNSILSTVNIWRDWLIFQCFVSDSLSLVRHLRSRIFRQPSHIFSTLQYHCKNSLFFSPFCFYFIASVTNPSTQNRFNSGHSTHSLSLANGYLDCHHLWVARIHFDIQWPLEATLLLVSSCVYIPLITWYIPQRTAKTLLLAIRLYWVLVFQASGAFKCYSWHLQISVCLFASRPRHLWHVGIFVCTLLAQSVNANTMDALM